MAIVPLIFSALALGMASLGDLRSVGRMAAKVVAIFIGMNLLAAPFGLIMGSLGKSAEPARRLPETIYQIMIKMVWIIMQYAPYGVCALMA